MPGVVRGPAARGRSGRRGRAPRAPASGATVPQDLPQRRALDVLHRDVRRGPVGRRPRRSRRPGRCRGGAASRRAGPRPGAGRAATSSSGPARSSLIATCAVQHGVVGARTTPLPPAPSTSPSAYRPAKDLPDHRHAGSAPHPGGQHAPAGPFGAPTASAGVTSPGCATTPWPPAAQIEIRPRPLALLGRSSLASVATIRPPVAANGWPAASEEPLTLSLVAVDRAQRRVEAEALLAEDRVLPRRERGQHLRGERLVDLVEVEVLERQAAARCSIRGTAYAGAISRPSPPWT